MRKFAANVDKGLRTAQSKVTLDLTTQLSRKPKQGHQFGSFHFHSALLFLDVAIYQRRDQAIDPTAEIWTSMVSHELSPQIYRLQ